MERKYNRKTKTKTKTKTKKYRHTRKKGGYVEKKQIITDIYPVVNPYTNNKNPNNLLYKIFLNNQSNKSILDWESELYELFHNSGFMVKKNTGQENQEQKNTKVLRHKTDITPIHK